MALKGYIATLRAFFDPRERDHNDYDALFLRRYSLAAISFEANPELESSTAATPPGVAKYDLGGKWWIVYEERYGASIKAKAAGKVWDDLKRGCKAELEAVRDSK